VTLFSLICLIETLMFAQVISVTVRVIGFDNGVVSSPRQDLSGLSALEKRVLKNVHSSHENRNFESHETYDDVN